MYYGYTVTMNFKGNMYINIYIFTYLYLIYQRQLFHTFTYLKQFFSPVEQIPVFLFSSNHNYYNLKI